MCRCKRVYKGNCFKISCNNYHTNLCQVTMKMKYWINDSKVHDNDNGCCF